METGGNVRRFMKYPFGYSETAMEMESAISKVWDLFIEQYTYVYQYEFPTWVITPGVTSKLDYFKELGIGTIKLSPIFSSAYDISPTYEINDFQKIHLTLGQMKDFDKLMKEAQTKGIGIPIFD